MEDVFRAIATIAFLVWLATDLYVLVWLATVGRWGTIAVCILCVGTPTALFMPMLYKPDEILPPHVRSGEVAVDYEWLAKIKARKSLVVLLNYGSLALAIMGTVLAQMMK